ncbi:hypothetical protein CJU89_1634 [Yarrowia sp. B02]|nr:hypothetical protein CJU89_1634 [Yarrowia sp. B02]
MRKVILQVGSTPGTKESVTVEPELHFRTLQEFDSHFQKLFENCPQTFKGYEVAFKEAEERWMPVEESLIGNWLSFNAANAPKWYIRPVNQVHFMRDHVAHSKLETVADSVLQMRAYIEEEMDEIKARAGKEIAAVRGEVWALKLKLDTLEQKKSGCEDLDVINESFPNDVVAHSSPKKSLSPKLQLGSAGELNPELFSTIIQFRVAKGTKEASIPKHVISCIKSLNSVPVIYALLPSGAYEPCKYVSEQHDKISREPEWESFCIGIQGEDELAAESPKLPTPTPNTSNSYAAALSGSAKPSVVKHPKPWIPKPLVKTEENFPSFRKDEVDDICVKTEKLTFTEGFLAAQTTPTKSACVWGVPSVEDSQASVQDPQSAPESATECGSPNSTQYSVASHTSPKRQRAGEDYVFVNKEAKPEQSEPKPEASQEATPAEAKDAETTPKEPVNGVESPKCNSCDKVLEKTHVHCIECETFNCCQECFKTTNQTHTKEHTFELLIYK